MAFVKLNTVKYTLSRNSPPINYPMITKHPNYYTKCKVHYIYLLNLVLFHRLRSSLETCPKHMLSLILFCQGYRQVYEESSLLVEHSSERMCYSISQISPWFMQ